jgi:hypothetical protein
MNLDAPDAETSTRHHRELAMDEFQTAPKITFPGAIKVTGEKIGPSSKGAEPASIELGGEHWAALNFHKCEFRNCHLIIGGHVELWDCTFKNCTFTSDGRLQPQDCSLYFYKCLNISDIFFYFSER